MIFICVHLNPCDLPEYCTITVHSVSHPKQKKLTEAKQNREALRGIQCEKSRKDTASSIKSGLNNWNISKSPKEGRNQLSGRVSGPCWHSTPVANAPC